MVRETRYLIVRNLPESCSEEEVIDHFQRYGKIQSVKLQAAKDNGGTGTATVAFNDIKSAAKAHHANNSLGEATLRTDYWEGSTQTPVLVSSAPASSSSTGTGGSRGVAATGGSYANPPASRPVSTFASWAKGPSEDDSGLQDKGDSNSALSAAGGGSATSSSTLALDKSLTAFDIPRGRARERFSKKKKFEKSGSFGRHGTSSRSLEAARSQSEAAAAAAASASSGTTGAAASLSSVIASSTSSSLSSTISPTAVSSGAGSGSVGVTSSSIASVSSNGPLSAGVHPVTVLTDGKDATSSSTPSANFINNNNNGSSSNIPASKDSSSSSSAHVPRDSSSSVSRSNSRHGGPHSRNATSHRKSGSHRSRSGSLASRSRSRSLGSRSSSSRSDSSGTSRSTSPHRSFSSNTMRPQSMVGASRLVSSNEANKDSHNRRSGEDSAGDGDRRALGICVTGLPMRSTDSSLRDGLYHEYKKHGKVTTVQIFGEGDNRCAVVSFRKPEDASKALEASQGKTFFGAKIKVTSHEGVEVDDTDRSSDNDSMDEYHQKSTRTLFVGNLEKETTTQDLIEKFRQFGEIIDVDIKRQGATTAFAFVQYVDIASVVAALRAMEGEHIGINKIKLGFGKSMPTCCVWLDNIPGDMSNRALRSALSRYGDISYCFIDRNRCKGLVCFSSFEDAQHCVSDIKQRPHFMKKKLQIDFASRECHTDFLDKMEESGQLRASDRPDESRVHKFRMQRSVDSYQDDGSPSSYGFNSTRGGGNVFNTPRSNGRSSATGSRRSRGFNDYPEENHSSSRRSSRRDDFGPGSTFYSKGGDDYDAVLREYGHSQRERRERDQSPRRMDSQSRRGSRDVSLDRYDDQRSKDRNSSLHNSRDTSPNSEHNSYRSESHRYRSSRGDDKYSSRGDRLIEDSKGENDAVTNHSHRSSRMGSPQYMNSNSMHSHESDYAARRGSRAGSRGSRSQSPDVTLLDEAYSSSSRGIFYPEDYKRSVVTEDELGSPYASSKRRDVLDIDSTSSKSRSLALLSNNKLGAEVAKTAAEKSRRRMIYEENLTSSDSKLLRKLEKSSPFSSSEREKTRHMLSKLASSKRQSGGGTVGSPGGLSSGGSQGGGSENGSAGEDLQHLHQRKQLLLMQIKELGDDSGAGALLAGGTGTPSDSDSPHFIKSVAVKDALRRSGRHDNNGCKVDEDRTLLRSDKLRRSIDGRRPDPRGPYYSMREDRTPGLEEEGSLGGHHSDSDYDSDKQRSKRIEGGRDIESLKSKDYHRQGSVGLSDSEDFEKKPDISARLNSNTINARAGCDIRSNSLGSKHLYEDKSLDMSTSPCDNGDLFKDRLSDKDILVINKHRNSSKSNSLYLPQKTWSKNQSGISGASPSPRDCFSPTLSDRGEEEDSVASSSLTEKSSKHPSSPLAWKRSTSVSPIPKDNDSEPDLSYLNNYNTLPDPLDDEDDDDDCLSDNSLVGGEGIPGPGPGDASWEERIRAIDRVLNMAPSSKASQEFSLGGGSSSASSSLSGTKDAANTDGSVTANRYAKFRIRKREEGGSGVGGSDISGTAGDNGSVLEQPSDIVQRVLSKKSILDQDFKRLEQVNNKYDTTSSGFHGSTTCGVLKDMPQLLLPSSASSSSSLSSLTVVKEEPLASPRSLSSKLGPPLSSAALSPCLNPVTTSSSVLQPTVTTCVAGSTLALSSSSSSTPTSSALGSSRQALTTSSVSTPISSISVSHENSGPKDSLDKSVKNSVVILKNSSSCSKVVSSQSTLLSVSSSLLSSTVTTQHTSYVSSLSSSSISVLVTSSTSHVFNVQHASSTANSLSSSSLSTTSSSLLQSKPVISSLPLPPSLLSSGTMSATTSTTSAVKVLSSHPSVNPTSPVSSNPSSLTSSSSSQPLACELANHGPAAAPFTQGPPSKSQQMPTLGQEAPQLTSPVFDPLSKDSSTMASALCPHLPGDTRLPKALSGQSDKDNNEIGHTPSSTSATSRASELTINLWGSKAEQLSVCDDNKSSNPSVLVSKPEVVTPDIESPVSVKSGTSSTDSVPLSSLDTKPCISVSEEKGASLLTAEHGCSSLKAEPISPNDVKDSSEKADSEDKINTFSNLLVPKKSEVSVPESATQATVLTVSSKNCPEKEEKLPSPDLGQLAKSKMDPLPPSSSLVGEEPRANSALQASKPSPSTSSNTTTSTASTTSANSARPQTDKNDKKTPSKSSSKPAASSRTEALFAPDLKLEPTQQKASSSSSKDNNKHKETHKSSSQSSKPSSSSGGSDKKSVKSQTSKDSSYGEKKDLSTSSSSREADKLDKKSDGAHKPHDGSSKSKDLDKNKVKEKREQSKESSGKKEKDEAKRKEDKKSAEKKEEKKSTTSKDDKKSEKKSEEKKEKSATSKQDALKHSKSDQELSKKEKEKKLKDKAKEAGKESKLDKKSLLGLSCVSKHSASPEPKSSKGGEGKPGNKESSSKTEKDKLEASASKLDSKSGLKQEQKHKGDQKTVSKTGDPKSDAKKSSSESSQKGKKEIEKPSSDSALKVKKEDEKQGADVASKGKREAEKVGSESTHKSKKEGDKDVLKPSSSKHSDKTQKMKQKEEERLKEKQRMKEQKEKEEKERKEKEEKEKQREREEKERQKEKEREEKERQKEKEREEKERQKAEKEKKDKEEKERKEREEKERLRKEKEDREKQKEKEKEERERQKEKEREEREKKEKEERERLKKEKEEKEKAKQKEREEKERKESEEKERLKKEKERKEKREKEKKKAKEEKLKKEKEAKAKREKEEKSKKEREEKEKAKKEKEKKEKEKEDKDEKKKPPPPKKQKRNELAALLDSNDSFQMSFTSMYDRVKTQRNRDTDLQPNKSPSSASQRSSGDKFKKMSNKKGSKSKSALYYSTSDLSDDDNLSEPNDSEDQSSKTELPAKTLKAKKTKQVKKRPHLSSSSSSSSSCEDDDVALLSATKSKGGKKTDIFSSDSEDDSFPPPSVKSSKSSKAKNKPPAPKKKKVRADSIDSVGSNSKDEFVKPQQLLLSSVTETESLDDMDLSETEPPKGSKMKKKKGKTPEKRDSSVESVSKKSTKVERDSSSESVARKPAVKHEKDHKASQGDKDVSPPKKAKLEKKKNKHTEDKEKSSMKEDSKATAEDKQVDLNEEANAQRKPDVKKGLDTSQDIAKTDSDKHKSKEKLSIEKTVSESKSSEKKKKKDRDDGSVKKKKKKYDLKEEEALVNSLITKVYDSKPDKERKKKKAAQDVFEIESDDLSLSEASLDVSQDKKWSMFSGKEESSSVKPKEKKPEPPFDSEKDVIVEKQQKVKPPSETVSKPEQVDKKPELQTKKEDHAEKVEKKKDQVDKKHESQDKKESKNKVKVEEAIKAEPKNESESDRSESGKPPKKKKKKDHDRDVEREKSGKNGKSFKTLSGGEKKPSDTLKGGDDDKKASETKTSQMDVDEFTSFWGHPKPILIPKRLKDSKKSEDDSSKTKEQKEDTKTDKAKQDEEDTKVKEESQDKSEDSPSVKTPDSVATPKVESDAGEDIVVPISEAETTVVTEDGQPASSESASTSDSLVINEEQTPETLDEVTGDMTAVGSSVEINDDDDFPSLIIDEVSETGSDCKKKVKKDKKQQKKQKDINDRLDEVIASVAMAGSSDEDEGARQSPDVNLQDVIDEELKYDNKSSNESESRKSFIVSDFVFPDDKRKSAESKSVAETDNVKTEPEKKGFLLADEETNKRDEDLLKKLFVLCDPSVDKPVEIEDPKVKEEERRKKEEEEKQKAEEEKKKAEEEKKKAEEKEKEEKDRRAREDSEETARAVECLLDTFGGDLSPLCIEPADREPPIESVTMSPTKEKSDVSIFPGSSIPEKVTTNLDDKLLERKSTDKVFGESTDTLNLFATPSQNTHVPMFTSPRRNSVGVNKDKTPEPVTTPSPQRQMRSPQRQPTPLQQSPQLPSPQQRPMPSPQQGPPVHSSPQKIQSPQAGFMQSPQQKTLPSPQQHHPQSPSPQRPNQSPHRVGLQSPLLSPQRSPFFKERSFISPGREPMAACTFPPHDVDNMPLVQQPQRRVSSGMPIQPAPEHALDPQAARRKSQEFALEQTLHSPRRNTISVPEEAATSVAHLDRRYSHGNERATGNSGGFFSKERSHSSLPQPVSISLDNAPHDKNYQSSVRSLTNLPHQDNVLLSPKQRGSPGFHHKEQHSLDQPGPFHLFQNKTSMPEQIFSGTSITTMTNQLFRPGQQPKVLPPQDSMLHAGKGLLLDKGGFKQTKGPGEQHAFRADVLDKPGSLSKDPLFLHQKGLHPEPMFQQGKDIHHPMSEPFGHSHNKPLAPSIPQPQQQQEPMFSPKTQSNSPYSYPDVGYDFLSSQSPPKMGPGLGNYSLSSSDGAKLNPIKQPPASLTSDPFSQDPLFIAMSEASARPPEQAPVPRRQDGLPPSFYQEPVPKPVFTPEIGNLQPQFDDEKKGAGTRKRRRSNKKLPKEGKDDALNEQAIQEIVHSKVEQIHQVHQANQAKAAAEKAGSKKAVDAYDFEAHTGLETGDLPSRPAMSDLHHIGHTDGDTTKPFRMRNEGRGRGRGARGGGRGRRGRGGANANLAQMTALQDKPQDPFHKSLHGSDQFNSQRRPGPQQQLPGLPQLDHHLQPHHDPTRLGGLPAPYHPPVSHHGGFPTTVSQPSLFSRQMPPQQASGLPGQTGFHQSFYQQQPAPPEGGPGAFNMQEIPPKQPSQQTPVSGITTSNFQHLPPPPVSAAATLPPISQQQPHQQPMLQLPQSKQPQQVPLKTSGGSDVLSPESNKQQHDLDSSYGESELVINLDDQPPSIEGKENQYSLSSDSEDRSSSSMAPSPATPRNQRATRTRKQPNYKAIASGMTQQQAPGSTIAQSPGAPGRTSRSGGSPRGLRTTGPGSVGPPASPKSPRNASSSPVVKLEKIEVGGGRTTRRGRSGMAGSKEDLVSQGDENSSNSLGQASEDWKTQGLDKPPAPSKDSIYDFADNEFDQQRDMPTSLRPNQRRNKKRGVAASVLEPPDTGVDYMPTSPASSANSVNLPSETKVGSLDSSSAGAPGLVGSLEEEPPSKTATQSLLSNMDAVIEAVAKGRFGDEEEVEDNALPATPASLADPALSPPHTRSSRRTSEAKKENLSAVSGGAANAVDQKAEKTTFSIAEPRFDNREVGVASRKGPTVPPLRIKVAHGMPKVEKEKHYVIASDHPQKPLSLTVKVAHKPAEGESGRDLGLFSGLPQGDVGGADSKNGPPSVATSGSQVSANWRALDTKADATLSEDSTPPVSTIVTTRAGGAMHPKVAAKVASQEAGKASSMQAAQQSKSSPLTSFPAAMTSVSGTPAHGPKHTWAAGHHLDQLQQAATSVAGGPPSAVSGPPHLPAHLLSSSGPVSPMVSGPQRSMASLQDSGAPPSAHNQRTMGPNPELVAEAHKHHQNQFGFPGHLPAAHGGSRSSFLLGSEGQGGHSMHYPGNLRVGADVRNSKSPSLQAGGPQQHKLVPGSDGRTRTPPVTSAGMLYSGVVSGMPRSLSPKSASPEGQVIERLPNPMRQGEQSPSPLGLRLPGSHLQDPSRFMKGPTDEHGREPPPAHGEQRAPSREMIFQLMEQQKLMEQNRLKQHLILASTGGGFPPPNMRAGEQPESAGGRKGSLSGASGPGQPLNLAEQESLSHRGTPKSTPPAPQSPFPPPMSFMDQRGGAPVAGNNGAGKPGDHLPGTVASAFMQPSPGGHPQHMYHPDFPLAGLAASSHHSPFGMMGRLQIDPRGIYSPGGTNGPPGGPQGQQQQGPPPHMLREGLPPGHFPPFPPRFDGKKGGDSAQDLGLGSLVPGGILQSPSQSPSLPRQLQPTDLVRMSALAHDMPARESPVGILQRFPVMWQGGLALKNESSYVQMHFIAGNRRLPSQALPQPLPNGVLPPLRISQRMRLEHSQLDGVAKRMQCEDDYCILIAVACGRDEHDINHQTRALNEGFITYLLSKQAAGIVNVPLPGSEQAGFVVHIFPPCEFVDNSVAQQGSEALMDQLRQIPHAVIIIATTFT